MNFKKIKVINKQTAGFVWKCKHNKYCKDRDYCHYTGEYRGAAHIWKYITFSVLIEDEVTRIDRNYKNYIFQTIIYRQHRIYGKPIIKSCQ